jgi:hypothetical protein
MANIDEPRAPEEGDGEGEGKKDADEPAALPRDAGSRPDTEEPEETFDLPRPARHADYDAEEDPDKRKADGDFDDLVIEVNQSELQSELDETSSRRHANAAATTAARWILMSRVGAAPLPN